MKTNITPQSFAVSFLMATLFLTLLPFSLQAETTERKPLRDREGVARTGGGNFCENIETMRDKALSRLEERKVKSDRGAQYDARRSERLTKLDTHRSTRNEIRDDRYEKLRAVGDSRGQEAAVEDFISTIERLVTERKAEIDEAISDFEDTVATLRESREQAVAEYADSIKDSINEMYDDAVDACEEGEDPASIRKDLSTAMSTMRETIRNDRDKYSFKDELETARAERKAAFEAARSTFQSGYQSAKEKLRAALAS